MTKIDNIPIKTTFIRLDNVIKALNATTSEEIETVTQCTSSFIASINVTADINDVPFLKINTDIDDKEMQRAYLFEETKGSVKKGCFIATAVYGSPNSPEVRFLRRYRDNTLSKSMFGRFFIKKYYTYSPNIANCLKPLSFIKILLKMIINTFIKIKNFTQIVRISKIIKFSLINPNLENYNNRIELSSFL